MKFDVASPPPGEVPPFVEGSAASEILIDGIAGITVLNGQIRMALYAEQQSFSGRGLVRPIVARMAMNPQGAHLIAVTLKEILSKLVEDKLIPPMTEIKLG